MRTTSAKAGGKLIAGGKTAVGGGAGAVWESVAASGSLTARSFDWPGPANNVRIARNISERLGEVGRVLIAG
jgi:hypothetical protein